MKTMCKKIGLYDHMKNRIICICILFSLLVSSIFIGKDIQASEIHVLWAEKYDSIDEMADDSEIIVKGKVIEQRTTQTENGTVYTISTLEIGSVYKGPLSKKIELNQLGGTTEDFSLSAPEECPLLVQGKEYIIFASQNSNSQTYYIKGAGQGVMNGDIVADDANYETVIKECTMIFNNHLNYTVHQRSIGTPSPGHKWNKRNLTYDIGYHDESSNYLSAIRSGVASWSGIAGFSLTETDYFGDITIRYDIHGNDNVCGYASVNTTGSTITDAHIMIYVYNSALTNPTRWRTLACHEVGHCLGLSHYTATSSSAMFTYIQDCSSYPQNVDIIGMNNLYL